ncbi:MAG: hypothetical protein M1824_000088 [Vezdaea acicularis]|nr:MAG: hypothetical protein M1824_000088 [Vezdaea acicularis]
MEDSESTANAAPSTISTTTTTGVKRPAPSLLPAFDPFTTSSPFNRPSKRIRVLAEEDDSLPSYRYPTPIPSSSIGPPPSSPRLPAPRAPLQRTHSTMSERAPLSAVPSVTVPESGQPLLMGRSTNCSHYQLSANRLISRVHIQATYMPAPDSESSNKIVVLCIGANGATLHCEGKTYELGKGDSLVSETEFTEIMVDVQDARVILEWPIIDVGGHVSGLSTSSSSPWVDDNSPSRRGGPTIAAADFRAGIGLHIQSPISPPRFVFPTSSTFVDSDPVPAGDIIHVYEDESESDGHAEPREAEGTQSTQYPTQASASFSQEHPEGTPVSSFEPSQDFSDDPNEENDPLITSFGPQGDNLLPRMASITAGASPEVSARGRTMEKTGAKRPRSLSESTNEADNTAVVNHAINQLAFSRLSSTPLSVIMNNLPAHLKGEEDASSQENKGLTLENLKKVLDATQCIGEIAREGKDAAGRPLECEYYYIPAEDTDEKRREAVVDGLQKPGLRACRKQHKVCLSCLIGLMKSILTRVAIFLEKAQETLALDQSPLPPESC